MPVTVLIEQGRIGLSVRGSVISSVAAPDPITAFRFTLGAGSEESWKVEVDDLFVR